MNGDPSLDTVEQLLAYSLALEQEAAGRYSEFAEVFETHNNREVAEFFRRMAIAEQKHADHVADLQAQAPAHPRYRGPDLGGSEAPDWLDMHYLLLPYHAITMALQLEAKAVDFFDRIAATSTAPAVRQLAGQLANEERQHVVELEKLLERYPRPDDDWDYDPDPIGQD